MLNIYTKSPVQPKQSQPATLSPRFLGGPGRHSAGPGRGLVDDISLAHALALLGDSGRASHLPERDARVVGALEPIESPVATSLESRGEIRAGRFGRDTAVTLTPAVGRGTVLVGASCSFIS